jgi:Family of unknown function (DUF5996)
VMTQPQNPDFVAAWPELPYALWQDTCTTLHLWLQIVGKIRLALSPWLNHSWHATFYPTARGLTTGSIPYGQRTLQITFDFAEHVLRVEVSDAPARLLPLQPQSVAQFHAALFAALAELNIHVTIHGQPNEVAEPIRFVEDQLHSAYDPLYAQRFWRVLLQVTRVFAQFRTGFIGKVSPVHFFWGSFDLAVTRFSGRRAPLHPGGVPHLPDAVAREAYSHEVSSAGFWPGGGDEDAAFYSYAYPEPQGFRATALEPASAFYHQGLSEFVLPYAAMRAAANPEQVLLRFLETSYAAAADAAAWDRQALECSTGRPRVPRSF